MDTDGNLLRIDQTGEHPPLATNIWQPVRYNWKPHQDITAYELALCLPILLAHTAGQGIHFGNMIEDLPSEARRHFSRGAQ